jgi:hypothetical protein
MEYVSGVARYDTGGAKYHLAVHGVPHLFGRERHVMRELGNYPVSFVAGTLKKTRAPERLNTVR